MAEFDEVNADDDRPTLMEYPRVGEAFVVRCSITPEDELGLQVFEHPESGERRIAIECAEVMEDVPESIHYALVTGVSHGKVVLTAAAARMFAARLLDAAELADGRTAASGTDWDKDWEALDGTAGA